jgi:tetratricopeptide (TPR) repeat protein
LYEKKGNIKKSKEYFESCLKDYGKNIYPNICSVRSMLGLSRLSLLEGDAENALEIIRFSIFQNPFDPEALFFLASLTYAAQGKKGLEDMGASLKADFGIESEWQGACAEHALWNSEVHAALAYLEKAQSSSDPRYRRLLWELQNNKIKKDFIASAG